MPEKREHLPTAWRVPDDVWALIQPLLAPEKPPATPGRRATAFRRVLDGLVYVLPTGCQWTALPRELGSGSYVLPAPPGSSRSCGSSWWTDTTSCAASNGNSSHWTA